MADVDLTNTGYTLWQHETGVDKVLNAVPLPIQSNYTTHEISPIIARQGGAPAVDKAFRVGIIEPDFEQTGNLTCTVLGRANARTAAVASAPLTIPEVATDATNEFVQLKQNARLMSFKFDSNTIGGDFEAGRVLGHIEETDGRMTQ